MAKLKFFTQEKCPKCRKLEVILEGIKDKLPPLDEYDVQTRDGLAEAAYYGVVSTPTLVLVDGGDNKIVWWDDSVTENEIIEALNAIKR